MNLIQKYLRTAVLIGPLPNNIQDGQVADAAPVMADFNWIVSQVNTNVPALVTGSQFNVKNFGAVGDGVTDDTVAIQAALSAAQGAFSQNGVVVYFPSGNYIVSSALSIARSGVQIKGDGAIATGITTTNATADILTLGDGISQYTYMSVIGISFASSVLRTAGAGLHLRFLYNAIVRDVSFTSQFTSMFWSDNCIAVKAENVNVFSVSAGGGGFVVDGSGSGGHDHYFTDCFLTGPGGNYAIELRSTGAFYMENVAAVIWAHGLHIQPTAAGKAIAWGFLTNCVFDTCTGPCIYISDNAASTGSDYVKGINFTNCWGSSGRNGVFIDGLGSAVLKGFIFDNCRFFANTQHGVVINKPIPDIRLQTCQIAGNGSSLANTYDGVNIAANTQFIYITNCNIGQWAGQPMQQRYGINLIAPTADEILIDGNVLTGNATAGLFNTINTVATNTSITTNNIGLNAASAMVPITPSEIWTTTVRWQADFSNATLASRCMFQDKTTNNNTNVGFISNGTGTTGGITLYGGSDPTNDSQLIISTTNSGASTINATKAGAGVNFGMVLQYNNSTAATITTVSDFATNRGVLDQSYSYQTPLTGFTITIAANTLTLILDPAGTLATGTVTMPAAPADGQIVVVASSQIVTALTVSPNAGQSIKNAPSTITAGGSFRYQYRNANTTWYKIQ